jgi:hypothetical protein
MDESVFPEVRWPSLSDSVFDRVMTLGWYDGVASGLAQRFLAPVPFKFDLLAWGPGQERRIFAFSPLELGAFEKAVGLMSQLEPPKWPRWDFPWKSDSVEMNRLSRELDEILKDAGRPEFVVEADSMFETLFATKHLSADCLKLLPDSFEGDPHLDNFDYWHRYVGGPA